MKKQLLLFPLWVLFSIISVFGQSGESNPTDLPTILPPSPTVTSLMRFEEVPINNYSGKPNIVFPIYTKQLAKGVTIPIALRYNTMGTRIDERSGWTGTGWALDGEAVISRTVMGIPDEINQTISTDNYGDKMVGIYHNHFFDFDWGTIHENSSNYNLQKYLWNASGFGSGRHEGEFDKQLDLYQLSLFGKTARFIVVKNAGVLEPKILENESNLKIIINQTSDYKILSFMVMDTNSNSYLFDQTEISHVLNIGVTESVFSYIRDYTNSEMEYISSWKISTIKYRNHQLASFTYQDKNEKFKLAVSRKDATIVNKDSIEYEVLFSPNNPFVIPEQLSYNISLILPKRSWNYATFTIASKKINSISFNDSISVHFEIDQNISHPEYIEGGSILKNIIIKKGSTEFKRFILNSEITPNNRLFINSIDEMFSTNSKLSYNFTYLNKEGLPEFENINKDIWGYHKKDESLIIPIYKLTHSADKEKVKTGVLTSIAYPNGGVKEFYFESNTFSHRGSTGFTDDNFAYYNPDNWIKLNRLNDFDNLNSINGLSDENISFSIDKKQELYLKPIIISTPVGDGDVVNSVFKIYKVNIGQPLEFVKNIPIATPTVFSLDSGNYILKFFTLTIPVNNSPIYKVNASLFYKNFKSNLSRFIYGGGLRIKEISFKDTDNSNSKKKIFYNYNNSDIRSSNTESSGVIDSYFTTSNLIANKGLTLTNTKEYIFSKKYQFASSCFIRRDSLNPAGNMECNNMITSIKYHIKDYLSGVLVSSTKNNFVGYGKVTISEIENGKKIITYTTPKDFPTYPPDYDYPFFPVTDKSYLQGNVKSQKIFEDSGKKVKQVDFTYYPAINITKGKSLYINKEDCYYTQYYNNFHEYLAKLPPPSKQFLPHDILILDYPPNFYNTCFEGSNIAPVYYEFYNHEFSKLLLKEKVTKNYYYSMPTSINPKIVETRKEYTYNLENYQPQTIETTDSRGNIFKKEIVYATPNYTSSNFTAEENTLINEMISQNIVDKPILTRTYKNSALLSKIQSIYKGGLPDTIKTAKGTNSLESRLTYHKYDSYGNVLDVSKEEGVHVYYVWGYHHSKPIAKIENFTSYATGSGLHPTIDPAIEALFENARNLSDIDLGLPINLMSGNLETELTVALEAIRTALPTSMVTTMTYNPLVGVTSITDPKGDVQYYTYDSFNRLLYVKDKDGNILKENAYHYKNQ